MAIPPSICRILPARGDPVHVDASTPTVNPTFVNDVGGSPYEGEQKPLCDTKLVT